MPAGSITVLMLR